MAAADHHAIRTGCGGSVGRAPSLRLLGPDPAGGSPRESWRSLFYANLIRDFIDEIVAGAGRNQGNFEDGARVQEVINAVERSYHERRWVDLPLPR